MNGPFEPDSIVSGLTCIGTQYGLSSGFLYADPTERQVLLDLSRQSTQPVVDSYLNPSYTDVWANEVRRFMADNKVDCQQDTTSRLFAVGEYDCIVGGCFEIEPDFVDDLFVLNTQLEEETNLNAFENFIEKWGHGSVEYFSFGAIEYQIYDLPNDFDRTTTMDYSTLYMGRAGGSAATITSDPFGFDWFVGTLYTEEECVDPAPVFLDYTPWEDILPELFPIWYADVYDTTALDMDGIREKFRELRETYRSLSEEIEEVGLSFVDCPRLDPGALTASPSSSAAPTNMPTSSNMPTPSTTEVPTRMPTVSPSTEPSSIPTNFPTVPPTSSLRTTTSPSAPPSVAGVVSSSPSAAPSPNNDIATTQAPTMTLTVTPTTYPSAEPSTSSSSSSVPTASTSLQATDTPSSSTTNALSDGSTNESDDNSGVMSTRMSNPIVFISAIFITSCFWLVF
jgi:hypothetical protein